MYRVSQVKINDNVVNAEVKSLTTTFYLEQVYCSCSLYCDEHYDYHYPDCLGVQDRKPIGYVENGKRVFYEKRD